MQIDMDDDRLTWDETYATKPASWAQYVFYDDPSSFYYSGTESGDREIALVKEWIRDCEDTGWRICDCSNVDWDTDTREYKLGRWV